MSRTTTRQSAQRARVRARRRSRGPADVMKHGLRSQSGVRVRSHAAWAKYETLHKLAVAEADRREALRAGWRQRGAAKAARRALNAGGTPPRIVYPSTFITTSTAE